MGIREDLNAIGDDLMQLNLLSANAAKKLARVVATIPVTPQPSGVPGRIVIVANSTGQPPAGISLAEGATFDLDALVYDAGDDSLMTNVTVTWGTSNASLATVNSSGVVSGVASGSPTITANANDAGGHVVATASVAVTVSSATVDSVTVSPSTVSLTVGGGTAIVVATPKDASGNTLQGRTVTAPSSDTNIATAVVSGYNITITAVGAGTCSITATCNGKTAVISVTINAASGAYPNKPSGMTTLSTTTFAGWTRTDPTDGELQEGMRRPRAVPRYTYSVIDNTAPFAGEEVLEWEIPANNNHGTGPEAIYNTTGGLKEDFLSLNANVKEVYFCFSVCVINGYKHSNGNGLQKFGHLWTNQDTPASRNSGVGSSTVVPGFTGTPSAIVDINNSSTYPRMHIRFQGMSTAFDVSSALNLGEAKRKESDNSIIIPAPYGGAKVSLVPGVWYFTEWWFKMNDPGLANGEAALYVDGVRRQYVNDLCYKNVAAGSQRFTEMQWNNTYGGILNTTPGQASYYRWGNDYHFAVK